MALESTSAATTRLSVPLGPPLPTDAEVGTLVYDAEAAALRVKTAEGVDEWGAVSADGTASGLGTTGDPVDISGSPPPTEGDVLVATGDGRAVWQTAPAGTAKALKTTGSDVEVGGAIPPVIGQVLTAVSETQAQWQVPGLRYDPAIKSWTTTAGQATIEPGTWGFVGQLSPVLPGPIIVYVVSSETDPPVNSRFGLYVGADVTSPVEVQLIGTSQIMAPDGTLGTTCRLQPRSYYEWIFYHEGATSLWGLVTDTAGVARSIAVTGTTPVALPSTAPAPGQSLVATDATHAAWQLTPNVYEVQRFAPGGVLTQANFHASLQAAINAAMAAAAEFQGGIRVSMPPGRWNMQAAPITIYTVPPLNYSSVALVGAGPNLTWLKWPAGYTGVCVDVGNEVGIVQATLSDFTIQGSGRAENGCTGVRLRGLVIPTMSCVFIRECGTALHIPVPVAATNVANFNALFCNFSFSWIGVRIANTAGSRLFGCDIQGNRYRDVYLEGGNQMVFDSCMFQSSSDPTDPPLTSIENNPASGAGDRVVWDGCCYTESIRIGTHFKLWARASQDFYTIKGFGWWPASGATFLDVTGGSYGPVVRAEFTMKHETSLSYTLLKARNARWVTLDGMLTPDEVPAYFDLDEYSRGALAMASPMRGRPWLGGASERLTLTEVLRPYAREIFDLGTRSALALTGDVVDSITGLIAGAVLTSQTAGQKFARVRDGSFGGNQYIHGTRAANTGAWGTLSPALAIGDHPGVFIVMRAWQQTVGIDYLSPCIYSSVNGDPLLVAHVRDGGSDGISVFYRAAGGTASVSFPFTNADPFALYFGRYLDFEGPYAQLDQARPAGAGYLNTHTAQTLSGETGTAVFPTPVAFDRVSMNGNNPAYGGDHDVAYFAVLRRPLPRSVVMQAMDLARARFRCDMADLIVI